MYNPKLLIIRKDILEYFTVLFCPLFFQILFLFLFVNLLKCKHRKGFGNSRTEVLTMSCGACFSHSYRLKKLWWAIVVTMNFSSLLVFPIVKEPLLVLSGARAVLHQQNNQANPLSLIWIIQAMITESPHFFTATILECPPGWTPFGRGRNY